MSIKIFFLDGVDTTTEIKRKEQISWKYKKRKNGMSSRRRKRELTEAVLSLNGLGRVRRFTRTCLVDSPDAELILITLLQVRNSALRHVALDLNALGPVTEAVLKWPPPKGESSELGV